jgi:hypothetical protein
MAFARSEPRDDDAELRVYRCSHCGHELRLTVWLEAAPPSIFACPEGPDAASPPASGGDGVRRPKPALVSRSGPSAWWGLFRWQPGFFMRL